LNTFNHDSLPRPTLLQFAVSAWVIGYCGAAICRYFTSPFRHPPLSPLGYLALLAMQATSTFARSRKEAPICTWLLVIITAVHVLTLFGALTGLFSAGLSGSHSTILIREALMVLFWGFAAYLSYHWSKHLSQFDHRPRFIRRYSLSELGATVTGLCIALAMFAGNARLSE